MADISKELQAIEKAIYGEEVRGSIHDAIDKINKLNDESATNSATARQTAERAETTANNAEAIAEISFGTEITSPVSPITGYVKGETYFNNQTNDLWQCNGVGWTFIGNLKGVKGDKGDESPKPTGIVLISQVGLVKTYNLLFSDGTSFPFQVSDGQSGTGTGDMLKVVYDRNDDGVVDAAEKLVDGNKVADTKVLVELKENSDGKLEYKGQAIAGELPEDAISDENFETKMNELINAIQAGTGVNVAEEVKEKLGDTSKLPGDGTVANAIEVVDEKFDYSTEEQVIGTWFGKPLYRKTCNIPYFANNTGYDIDGILNVENLIKAEFVSGKRSDTNTYTGQYWANTTDFISYTSGVAESKIRLYMLLPKYSLSDITMIFEYTKTTD